MRFAIVENGTVINVVRANDQSSASLLFPGCIDVTGTSYGVGDAYNGSSFSKAASFPVPQSVSPLQIRLALLSLGILETIKTAVENASGEILEMWRYAKSFDRDDTSINQMASTIGISQQELDNIFIIAAGF